MLQQDTAAGTALITVPLSKCETDQQERRQGPRDNEQYHDTLAEMGPVSSVEPSESAMVVRAVSFGDDEAPGQKERRIREKCGGKCYESLARRRPRIFALTFGFLLPLLSLVALAALCGYPLALMETPIEVESNDEVMAQQMRLLAQTSLYTNFTQHIPQICLKLSLSNMTTNDFLKNTSWLFEQHELLRDSLVDLKVEFGEQAASTNTTSVREDALALKTTLDNMWDYLFLPVVEIPEVYEAAIITSELTQSVAECGAALQPLIDKMFFNLMKTAQQALSANITFAWTRCPANATNLLPFPGTIPPSFLLDYILYVNPPFASSDLYNDTLFSFVSY
jgi:hypothetical protein